MPVNVTLDAYAASHRAVAELKDSGELPKSVVVRGSSKLGGRQATLPEIWRAALSA